MLGGLWFYDSTVGTLMGFMQASGGCCSGFQTLRSADWALLGRESRRHGVWKHQGDPLSCCHTCAGAQLAHGGGEGDTRMAGRGWILCCLSRSYGDRNCQMGGRRERGRSRAAPGVRSQPPGTTGTELESAGLRGRSPRGPHGGCLAGRRVETDSYTAEQ